jgi:hypothetical protein
MALVGLHNPPIEIGGFKMIDGFSSFIFVQKKYFAFFLTKHRRQPFIMSNQLPPSVFSRNFYNFTTW